MFTVPHIKDSYFSPPHPFCQTSFSSPQPPIFFFLGGLSLHLNHLIESCMTNYDWPFGTFPFGLFGSNLDTRHLETYPTTYSGHFEIYQFLTIPGPFEYFSENGWSQKIKVFSMKERSLPPYWFSFRRRGP